VQDGTGAQLSCHILLLPCHVPFFLLSLVISHSLSSLLLIDDWVHINKRTATTNDKPKRHNFSLSSSFITTILLEARSNENQTKDELNTVLPQYSTISMNKVGHKEDEGVISYSDLEPKKSHLNCAGVVALGFLEYFYTVEITC
jgi:hypothetical protein